MTKRESISMYLTKEDKSLINISSRLIGLDTSAFCRMTSLERARQILRENREENAQ